MYFREIRRALPKEDIFSIEYENMLDEDLRLSILSRMIHFIGKQTWDLSFLCDHLSRVSGREHFYLHISFKTVLAF